MFIQSMKADDTVLAEVVCAQNEGEAYSTWRDRAIEQAKTIRHTEGFEGKWMKVSFPKERLVWRSY